MTQAKIPQVMDDPVPVRSVAPEGGHLVKLTQAEWIKIIVVLAIHGIGMFLGAWSISLSLEHRLTKIETKVESVREQQVEIKADLKALRP